MIEPDDPSTPFVVKRLAPLDAESRPHVGRDLDPLRLLGVVAVMALAMLFATATLASAPVGTLIHTGRLSVDHPLLFFGDGQFRVRSALFGLVFVAWVSIALVVTRPWHGFRPVRRTAIQGATAVGLGLTLILVVAAALSGINLRAGSWAAFLVYVVVSAAASVSCAYLVSRATMFVTGRSEPLLSRSMFLWAGGWVGIQQTIEHSKVLAAAADAAATGAVPGAVKIAHAFAPELVLAWQLPLGLAVAVWFARTHSSPAAKLKNRADAARWWGKATVLVGSVLLLLWVAVASIERNRVPLEEADVVEQPPDDVDE
jgi:hypothetical protein